MKRIWIFFNLTLIQWNHQRWFWTSFFHVQSQRYYPACISWFIFEVYDQDFCFKMLFGWWQVAKHNLSSFAGLVFACWLTIKHFCFKTIFCEFFHKKSTPSNLGYVPYWRRCYSCFTIIDQFHCRLDFQDLLVYLF